MKEQFGVFEFKFGVPYKESDALVIKGAQIHAIKWINQNKKKYSNLVIVNMQLVKKGE